MLQETGKARGPAAFFWPRRLILRALNEFVQNSDSTNAFPEIPN